MGKRRKEYESEGDEWRLIGERMEMDFFFHWVGLKKTLYDSLNSIKRTDIQYVWKRSGRSCRKHMRTQELPVSPVLSIGRE